MKSLFNILALLLILYQFAACKKDAAKPTASLPVTASNIAGNFTVGSFINASNQTATFSGFSFTFNANGSIIATNGTDTFSGSWQLDDGNTAEIKINFSGAPLNLLNGSWHIDELTADHMQLGDDNQSEEAGDDHSNSNSSLEFERD